MHRGEAAACSSEAGRAIAGAMITTLDAGTALVVVDLQKAILSLPVVHPVADVVARAAELAKAFRRSGRPVVLVNVASGPKTRCDRPSLVGELPAELLAFAPELEQSPSDHVVTKRGWGAFTDTGLGDRLRSAGVTQVVVAGVATSIGVESTARQAQELGFNVAFALDAMTDTNAEAHARSVAHIFPRVGETGSTEDILRLLADPPG